MRVIKCVLGVMLVIVALSAKAQDDDKPVPYKRPTDAYSKDTVSSDMSKLKGFDNPKKKFDMSKLLIEPNVQLFFTSDEYQFGLMPSLGYRVYKNLYVGGSLNYNLIYVPHLDGTPASPSVTQQVYGGGPFIHYKIWKGFFTRLRFEMLAIRYPDSEVNPNNGSYDVSYATVGVPYVWIGAGYNLTPSKNLFIPIAVYVNPLWGAYNGTQQEYSPYSWVYFQVAFYIFSPGR